MRTIFSAVKTGVLNGIAGAVSLAIVWKASDILLERSFKETKENAKDFFSSLRDLAKGLINR